MKHSVTALSSAQVERMFESRLLAADEGIATDMAVHCTGFCAALATSKGHILIMEMRDGSMRHAADTLCPAPCTGRLLCRFCGTWWRS